MSQFLQELLEMFSKLLTEWKLGELGAKTTPKVTVTIPLGSGYNAMAEENAKREAIVMFMRSQLGKPYDFGVEVAPGHEQTAGSWDCSEFSEGAYRLAGLSLPDGARYQFAVTQPVKHPKPGDLFFLWSDKRGMIGHVMTCASDKTLIHAVGGRGVVEDPISQWENHPRGRGWRRHVEFARPKEDIPDA